MPEGPEVKRSADHLSKRHVGMRLRRVEAVGGRYVDRSPDGTDELNDALRGMEGMRIEEVSCKGKFMYWTFRPGWTMWCTYGMSGQWTSELDKHAALTLWVDRPLEDLTGIHFRDPRHFGTLKFIHEPDGVQTQKKLDTLGPDMLSEPPSLDTFKLRLLKKPDRTVCEALMDQSCISGVGNYIKAEALYLAEISPHRKVSDLLPHSDFRRLREQIINVMKASYNTGGATIRTYRNPDGSAGEAQGRFVVYGNKTDPMGNPVVKEETPDGRTTHWVPAVQR